MNGEKLPVVTMSPWRLAWKGADVLSSFHRDGKESGHDRAPSPCFRLPPDALDHHFRGGLRRFAAGSGGIGQVMRTLSPAYRELVWPPREQAGGRRPGA